MSGRQAGRDASSLWFWETAVARPDLSPRDHCLIASTPVDIECSLRRYQNRVAEAWAPEIKRTTNKLLASFDGNIKRACDYETRGTGELVFDRVIGVLFSVTARHHYYVSFVNSACRLCKTLEVLCSVMGCRDSREEFCRGTIPFAVPRHQMSASCVSIRSWAKVIRFVTYESSSLTCTAAGGLPIRVLLVRHELQPGHDDDRDAPGQHVPGADLHGLGGRGRDRRLLRAPVRTAGDARHLCRPAGAARRLSPRAPRHLNPATPEGPATAP